MQQATTQKPDEGILWVALGDAQLGSADAAAKAAKAAGKPVDPTIQAKFADAARLAITSKRASAICSRGGWRKFRARAAPEKSCAALPSRWQYQ